MSRSAELKKARESAGLSFKRVAELSDTPERNWRSWEDEGKNGRRPPGIAFAWLELYTKQP